MLSNLQVAWPQALQRLHWPSSGRVRVPRGGRHAGWAHPNSQSLAAGLSIAGESLAADSNFCLGDPRTRTPSECLVLPTFRLNTFRVECIVWVFVKIRPPPPEDCSVACGGYMRTVWEPSKVPIPPFAPTPIQLELALWTFARDTICERRHVFFHRGLLCSIGLCLAICPESTLNCALLPLLSVHLLHGHLPSWIAGLIAHFSHPSQKMQCP